MRLVSHTSFVLCFVLLGTNALAHTFKTEKLRQAATDLCISGTFDSIMPGQTLRVFAKDGQEIAVRAGKNAEIEHIGIPMFSERMRTLMPSPVYDFMEYAALNWKYKVNPNTLYLSKVLFRKGNWEVLVREKLDRCDCSIENMDEKLYVVTWQRDSQNVAVVGVPIEYELLSNDNRRNIEKDFIRQLMNYVPSGTQRSHSEVSEDELNIYGTEGLFVKKGTSYILPELNQNIYYSLKTVYQQLDTFMLNKQTTLVLEDVVPEIVIDQEHPNESLANLMICNDLFIPDVQVDLDFHLSDYHRQHLVMPLSQLKDFCCQQGCSIYFASSGLVHDSQIARGVLLAHNPSQGYNHLFSISIPIGSIVDSNPEVKAAAYMFIPLVDKSHLFGTMPKKKSGAKIKQKLLCLQTLTIE